MNEWSLCFDILFFLGLGFLFVCLFYFLGGRVFNNSPSDKVISHCGFYCISLTITDVGCLFTGL